MFDLRPLLSAATAIQRYVARNSFSMNDVIAGRQLLETIKNEAEQSPAIRSAIQRAGSQTTGIEDSDCKLDHARERLLEIENGATNTCTERREALDRVSAFLAELESTLSGDQRAAAD